MGSFIRVGDEAMVNLAFAVEAQWVPTDVVAAKTGGRYRKVLRVRFAAPGRVGPEALVLEFEGHQADKVWAALGHLADAV